MIRILHFSDIHFGVEDQGKSQRILQDFERVAKEDNEQPDLCIFSGDLTQSGKEREFEQATDWLLRLFTGWTCPLFIVPGNHDLVRPQDPDVLKDMKLLRSYCSGHADHYKEQHANVLKYAHRFDNFFKFHASLKSQLRLESAWSKESFFGTDCQLNIQGQPVSICGLNSAALSFDGKDAGNLIVDEKTFNDMLAKSDSRKSLTLAVSHHPIAGRNVPKDLKWLTAWNADRTETLLLQDSGPHIFFHGHVHRQKAEYRSINTGQHVYTFGAGAAYSTEKHPLKFGYYEVDLNAGEILPTVFEFDQGRSGSGRWSKINGESRRIFSALPRPHSGVSPACLKGNGHTKARLRECIESYCAQGEKLSILDDIFLAGCQDITKWLLEHDDGFIQVHTSMLYSRIINAFKDDASIKIIDHDINRWNELLYDYDTIAYNTFNYSRDILQYTVEAAEKHRSYSLKRVFVLNKAEDLKEKAKIERIVNILQHIQEYTDEYPQKIETRMYIADEAKDISLRKKLQDAQDVVFVSGNTGQYVFREKFSFAERRRADLTKSEVSIRPADLKLIPELHDEVFQKSISVRAFLERYGSPKQINL